MVAPIVVAGRKVGVGQPCFVVAEAGVNHNGDIGLARQLVDVAARAGSDAVKFQTFNADRVISPLAPKAEYQLDTTDRSESQLEMLRRLELSPEAHIELQCYCQEKGILFMSTPGDEKSAAFLYGMDVPVFKIPSGEITNLPFIAYVSRFGKPMFVSTGMANLSEVAAAVRTIEESGNRQFVLMHCVSNYPANPADVNLRAMHTMGSAFHVPIGYSDHTLSIAVPVAAVALGACVIEKHFTLDRNLPGPDHRSSLEPDEFAAMVQNIRTVEVALGHGRKEPARSEANTAAVARKSLVAAQDIPAGATLTEELIAIKRPGTGLPPVTLPYLIGRTLRISVPAGQLLQLEMFQ